MYTTEKLFDIFEKSDRDHALNFLISNLSMLPDYEVGSSYFRTKKAGKIFGFDASEIVSVDQIYEQIHPDDLEFVVSFTMQAIQYLNELGSLEPMQCTSHIVFRCREKGRKTRKFHRKSIVHGVDNFKVTHNVTFLEDVSWMKLENDKSFALEGKDMEFFDFEIPEVSNFKELFGKREIEVLRLLARGLNSREVGQKLHISKHTVDTHRRNMLKKTETSNSMQLLALARDMNLF